METFFTPILTRLAELTDFEAVTDMVGNTFWMPFLAITIYCAFVHGVPLIMKDRQPLKLRRLNTIWNLSLAVFSFIGAWYCWPRLIEVLTTEEISGLDVTKGNYFYEYKNSLSNPSTWSPSMIRHAFKKPDGTYGIHGGFDTSACVYRDDIYRRGVVGYINLLFLWSKYFELFDTVLLVLQKKPVIFLHWYHHVTVLLYCAHAWVNPIPGGIWFSTMNLTVHAVMYTYYFLASLNYRKLIAPIAPFITVMQIAQMIVGTFIAIYTAYQYEFGYCDTSKRHVQFALVMYFSYLILFTNFFVQRYIVKKKKKSSEGGNAKPKRE